MTAGQNILPASARLRTQQHFRRVYQRGSRARGSLLTVIALQRRPDDRGPRLGVSVSKDHGPAVRRNKIKRLLRTAFRIERSTMPDSTDVILIPRQSPAKLRLVELRRELVSLLAQALSDRRPRRRPRRRPEASRPTGRSRADKTGSDGS